jgi:phenylacetate-CoA ligase
MIHDPELETLERERLHELQVERLRAVARYAYERIGLYRERFKDTGVSPDQIRSLDDLRRLPFTRKSDLRDSYPFGMFAVPREDIARIHGSSGTTGKPTVVGYTRADLEAWTELMARCLTMAGVRPGMVVHNANGYGLFTGGLGFHYGAERIGATVVPISGGFTTRQAMLLRDLGGQVLSATPSYALAIAQAVRDAGIDLDELRLELGLFGGEPFTGEMGAQIERELGLTALMFYGLSEMCGPGARGAARAGGPLPRRGDRPRQRPPGRRGRGGRAGLHHARQGGAAADPLPHGRHRLGDR